ncbi:hypothetical protein V8F06_012766 [Rhypophila decipiens]
MDSPNPEQELPNTIDIVSTIGTWATVILALVALLGIIAPYLALRSAQSDLRVPILHGVPNEQDSPKLKYVISGDAGTFPDEEILPISKTGWVNLANLASVYINKVPREDSLVIRQQNSWLPVNRFIILAMGLRGRYGHRTDRGERLDTQTRARLFTETLDTGEEEACLDTQTAGKIFGTTGIIWWRQTLGQNEARSDEVCFAPHPEPLRGRHTIDPTPLDELFWLAIGCLPVRDESRKDVWVVYDLNYEIRRAHRTTQRTHHNTSRISNNTDIILQITEVAESETPAEVPRDTPLRFARLDQERIAVGVLRLRPSPHRFLMLPGCNILSPYLLEGSAKSRFQKAVSLFPRFGPDESISGPLLELDSYVDAVPLQTFSRKRAELCFKIISRLENPKYRLNFEELRIEYWAIAVLILINRDCYNQIKGRLEQYSNTGTNAAMPTLDVTIRHEGQVELAGQRYNINLSGLFPLHFPTPPGGPAAQPDAQEDPGHPEATQLEPLLGANPAPLDHVDLQYIADIFLWTAVRLIMVSNTIDSNPLLSMVKNMDDVVLVSASTSPAPIYFFGAEDDRRTAADGPGKGDGPSGGGRGDGGDGGGGGDGSGQGGESDKNTGHVGQLRRQTGPGEETRHTTTERREDPGPSRSLNLRRLGPRQGLHGPDDRVGKTGRFRKPNPAAVKIADEGESDDTDYGPDGRARLTSSTTSSDDGTGKDKRHRD